ERARRRRTSEECRGSREHPLRVAVKLLVRDEKRRPQIVPLRRVAGSEKLEHPVDAVTRISQEPSDVVCQRGPALSLRHLEEVRDDRVAWVGHKEHPTSIADVPEE